MFPEPSAPLLVDLIKDEEVVVDYNCEEGCDVEFLVGKGDEELIRIPVHSQKLSEYPVFKAMLSESYDVKYNTCVCTGHDGGKRKLRQIRVNWIDRKAFDNVMKFIYRKPVNLQAPEMTVETLKAAHEFILPGLVRACVKQLGKMISRSNVLFIFANVRFLCNDLENLEELIQTGVQMPTKRRKSSSFTLPQNQTGFPVASGLDSNPQDNYFSAGLEMKNLCMRLLSECLAFIDVHASKVLESDEIEELDRSYLKLILQRDSLDASEQAVFSALVRWAETECKRQHLPLTNESKRLVLDDLIYIVRFFQMTIFEFLAGPGDSGLLSSGEVELIKNVLLYINGNPREQLNRSSCFPATVARMNPVQNHDELQLLKSHWKYMVQPRKPRLNNGNIGKCGINKGMPSEFEKNRKRFSLDGTPKKGLQKFKRVGLLVKNFCIPCAFQNVKTKWIGNADQFLLINNDLTESSQGHNKISGSSQLHETPEKKSERPRTLKRNESSISKAFDYSLRAFAFFFD